MPEYGPLTCAGCGLLCDDVTAEQSGHDVRLRPACRLGAQWFSERWPEPGNAPAATIDGQPADIDSALARAIELLRAARRPLVHGFGGATVEDTRAALALADRVGALVVTEDPGDDWPGAPAVALRGESTATLGETRDRSQVVVVWREDPEITHPRLLERLGFGAGEARARRMLVVCDDRDTVTAGRADLRLRWTRERDLAALVELHARVREVGPDLGELSAQLDLLIEPIYAAPHVTFVYGTGLTGGTGGQRRALALHELVRALCDQRHAVTLALPRAAGTRGAQAALAWQTGYGANVDLAGGHPEPVTAARRPGSDEGVDVALRIEGAGAPLGDGVAEIALCSRGAPAAGPPPAVSIRTAAAGIQAGGTVHRLDGVPLSLQPPLPGDAPTAASLLARLRQEVEG